MATIIMSAQQVIDAATKVIADIEAKRKKKDEDAIYNAIHYARRFSFKRGFYRMNREEAIAWVHEQNVFGMWGFSAYAWGTLAEARALLKLAQHGDPVTLNQNDIAVLF